jgi:uncharacterized membrane protein
MHPFYGPSAGLLGGRGASASGLLSMAAYLAFWAGAIVLARRELDARFPRGGRPSPDRAMEEVRARYARGEIDEQQLRAMAAVLADVRGGGPVGGGPSGRPGAP